MPVITGNDADKRYAVVFRPRFVGAEDTRIHCVRKCVIHQFKRRTVARNYHVGSNAHQVGKNTLHLGYAVKHTVISKIDAALSVTVLIGYNVRKQGFGKVKLFGARLASRHIERKPSRLVILILFFEFRKFIFRKFIHNITPVRPQVSNPVGRFIQLKFGRAEGSRERQNVTNV